MTRAWRRLPPVFFMQTKPDRPRWRVTLRGCYLCYLTCRCAVAAACSELCIFVVASVIESNLTRQASLLWQRKDVWDIGFKLAKHFIQFNFRSTFITDSMVHRRDLRCVKHLNPEEITLLLHCSHISSPTEQSRTSGVFQETRVKIIQCVLSGQKVILKTKRIRDPLPTYFDHNFTSNKGTSN